MNVMAPVLTGTPFTTTVCEPMNGQPSKVPDTEMVCVPGPAAAGLKVVPVTPGPLKVPGAGKLLKVTGALLTQAVAGRPLMIPFSLGSTFTSKVRNTEHKLASRKFRT